MASVSVTFYSGFKKRRNSTKQPTGGTSLSCLLKENTTVEAPTFIIKEDGSSYTYCSAFGNYYYVTEREYVPPHWHMHCAMDYMATFKTDIGNSSQYIERADSAVAWDKRLLDMLPTQTGPSTQVVGLGESFFPIDDGCYVITISGSNSTSGATTGVNRFVFREADYRAFMQDFLNQFSWADPVGTVPGAITDSFKAILKPMDYILDIRWYPFWVESEFTQEHIWLGAWETEAYGYLMHEGYIWSKTSTMIIPKHPQNATDGLFLNAGIYSKYCWVDPFFGTINIDGNSICDCGTITYRVDIDPSCGYGHMKMYATVDDQMVTIAERTAEFGVPQYRTFEAHDVLSALSNVTTDPAGAFSRTLAAIAQPKIEVAGSCGSKAMYQFQPLLYCEFFRIKPLNSSLQGYPVCATYTINSFSGYVKCFSGEVNTIGNPEAKAEVKNFLEGGFFYE